MPLSEFLACEGPSGTLGSTCPQQRCDNTVKNCQGDIHLCPSCKSIRFPQEDVTIPKYAPFNTMSTAAENNSDTPKTTPIYHAVTNEVVIQPLLSYILFSMSSGTVTNIIRAVVNHFTLDDIEEAKNVLWAKCDNSLIGTKQNRRDSTARTEKEAHVQDIINALQRLDATDKVPNLVIDARSLHMIPRSHPEELNNISAIDRLNRLEARMGSIAS